jgi:hypothetical protein
VLSDGHRIQFGNNKRMVKLASTEAWSFSERGERLPGTFQRAMVVRSRIQHTQLGTMGHIDADDGRSQICCLPSDQQIY